MPSSSLVPKSHTTHDRASGVDDAATDNEAWDSSSIASSRPSSPFSALQVMDDPGQVVPGHAETPEKGGDEDTPVPVESMDEQEVELELEPVPGLLSGRRHSSFVSKDSSEGPADSSRRRVNSIAVTVPKRDDRSSELFRDGGEPEPSLQAHELGRVDEGIIGECSEASNCPDPHPSRTISSAPPHASVDSTHARPSLNMTPQEFSEAKAIILDLLGWGVPPEYLINCGLARESIYYAFTEMNLRLPSNLNVEGIIPYEPPDLPM